MQTISEVEAYWDDFTEQYVTLDGVPNVFYLSLLNMLRVENRQNILEVGAGAGFLIQHTISRKRPEAKYYATDLSENMLQVMMKRLKVDTPFKDRLFIEQYNLMVEKIDGENMPYADNSFDCYICNMCLQLTADPAKMLKESHRVLEKGGVAGFTVWGDKVKSTFVSVVPSVLAEYGINPPPAKSNFTVSDRENLIKMMEDAGFTNVICWNQFSPYPHITEEDFVDYLWIFNSFFKSTGDKTEEIKAKVLEKLKDYIHNQKYPLGRDALVIIGTKS